MKRCSLWFDHWENGATIVFVLSSSAIKNLECRRHKVSTTDSSLGEVHRESCSEDIHMEEEKVEVKVQEDEVEDGRDKWRVQSEGRTERTDNHSGAWHIDWDDARAQTLEPMSCDMTLQVRAVNETTVTCEVYCLQILPYAVLWIHWLPRYTQILIWNHCSYHGSPHAYSSCLSCKASGSH